MAAWAEYELSLKDAILHLTIASASDRGNIRSINEDSFFAEPGLFIVADGMGGHSFGDRASQSVAATFAQLREQTAPLTPERVVHAIHEANTAVLALSDDEESVSGTTLSGVALVEVGVEPSFHWMAFNVGDSRVYSWDGRALEQVTVDHSAVQELLDEGSISALEAIEHPNRNVVTRALGVPGLAEPDIWLLPLGGQQSFLICSDGLTKELADDQIALILSDRASLLSGSTVADRLVQAALAAGGRDNVTVVVVESTLKAAVSGAHDATTKRDLPNYLERTRPRK